MCTATFLPLGKNKFILTHNRDEHTARKAALLPALYTINNMEVVYPKDAQANGTWIATNKNNFTLCLLNGAFDKHESKLPYKKSRGLVVLDFFYFEDVFDFADNYDFKNIEPFTLIIVDTINELQVFELRWNGTEIFLEELDNKKPKIWSSATLYTKQDIAMRETWFAEWLIQNKNFTPQNILAFHNYAPQNKEGFVIKRADNKVTVSLTQVHKSGEQIEMHYQDLVNKQNEIIKL